jgi:hypothetical protein
MQNLISRDGVNHKRYGWRTQLRLREDCKYLKIKGIFNFKIFGEDFFIVYADKRFWQVDLKNKTYEGLNDYIDTTILEDTECQCFVNGNKAYFLGCGDYLVFSEWDDEFKLRRVVDCEDVYIPTTTTNITCEEDTANTRVTLDEVNLLSKYRYNLLIGKELQSEESATFYLDMQNADEIEVEVTNPKETVTLKVIEGKAKLKSGDSFGLAKASGIKIENKEERSYAFWQKPYISAKIPEYIDLVKFNTNETLVIKLSVGENGQYEDFYIHNSVEYYFRLPTLITAKLGFKKEEYSNGSTQVTFKEIQPIEIKKATVTTDREPILDYDDRVGLTFNTSITFYEFNIDLTSYNLTISEIKLGTYQNLDSLVLSNGSYRCSYIPKEGKLRFEGMTTNTNAYAPLVADVPNIKVKLGKDINTNNITKSLKGCEFGLMGASDRLFIVDTVGNLIRWSKDEDYTYFGEKSYCICGTADKKIKDMERLNDSTMVVVKEYSIVNPSVYVLSGNIETREDVILKSEVIFKPRGYMIGVGVEGKVCNYQGELLMVARNGVYALTLGDNVSVDSRYAMQRSRQISNTLEQFDLSKAKCVSYNGKFYLSVDGECFVADNKYVTSHKGDLQNSFNYEWWRWTNMPVEVWGFVNNELWFGTEDGQLCKFEKDFYDEEITFLKQSLILYDIENNGFDTFADIKVYEGDKFTFTCDFYGGITTKKIECLGNETRFYVPLSNFKSGDKIYIDNTAYEITVKDTYFSIGVNLNVNEVTYYKNYKGEELTVSQVENLQLVDREGNFPIIWAEVGSINPLIENFTATLSHKDTVVARWVSGAIDLGTRVYSKSLTFVSITGEKDLANRFTYGIRTRLTKEEYELLRKNSDLDFEKLDLETVSLDSEFASTYTKRLNIRDANFIMFYYVSNANEDIAINSVAIEFKLNKRNIGVK